MEDRQAQRLRREQSWFHEPGIWKRTRNRGKPGHDLGGRALEFIYTKKRKRFKSLKVTLRNNYYQKRRDVVWWSINETWDDALRAEPWQIQAGNWFLTKDEPFS